jgi:signal transduction histidine kinase
MLPLVVQDRAIGLIELMEDEDERIFREHEIELEQTLASHAAIAFQNADLYRRLQNHAAELETRVQSRTAELRAAKANIRLAHKPLSDLPPAMADPNWLSQALSNLLTNAINYTPAGGSIVLGTDVKASKRRNWVTIKVIDNGVGNL